MRKMKQETNKATLSEAGILPREGKTRVVSLTTEWGFRCLQTLVEVRWGTDSRCTSEGCPCLICHIYVWKTCLLWEKKSLKSMHGQSPVTKNREENQSALRQHPKHETNLHLIVEENHHGNVPSSGQWFISGRYPCAHRELRNASW